MHMKTVTQTNFSKDENMSECSGDKLSPIKDKSLKLERINSLDVNKDDDDLLDLRRMKSDEIALHAKSTTADDKSLKEDFIGKEEDNDKEVNDEEWDNEEEAKVVIEKTCDDDGEEDG